jgi:hypothetical protein
MSVEQPGCRGAGWEKVKIPTLSPPKTRRQGWGTLTQPLLEKLKLQIVAGWNFLDLFLRGSEMEGKEGTAFRLLDWRDFEELGWGL